MPEGSQHDPRPIDRGLPDPLDDCLAEAFGRPGSKPPATVLQVLQSRTDSVLALHLDSQGLDDAPVSVTTEAKQLRDVTGRYQMLGEIGRGGVGVVFKGRDTDLGRDVAMKVLKEDYADSADVLSRFVEEAQIGGQLQHPGIVPVYELGLQESGRPYFAMKLVKGETLADQLARRGDATMDRPRLLGIFEQVCQAMAYAHARRVIHRDLKPANVMIGAFGEVQVVDWGLAKVLPKGGVAAEEASVARAEQLSVIETVRSGSGSHSMAGSRIGTPAYMPPEQAQGQIEWLDQRSDVFGLGAILCEILTGAPPYRREDGAVISLAALAALDPARQRLAACGADVALVALCLECLEPVPSARPASAQVLAERIGAYLASVEERARAAELKAAQSRMKQRVTLLASAAGLLILTAAALVLSAKNSTIRTARDDALAAQESAEAAAKSEAEQRALAEASAQRAKAAETVAEARAVELQQVAAFQAEQLESLDVETMGVRLRRTLLAAGGEDRLASLTKDLAGLNFTSISLEVLEQNLFAETIASIDRQFEDQPMVQAQLLGTMGGVLSKLGLLDLAMDPTKRALAIRREKLGDDHPDTLLAISGMGGLLSSQNKLDEAEPFFREALEGCRRVLGDDHPSTLLAISGMGVQLFSQGKLDEAEPFLREALEGNRRVLGEDHPSTLSSILNMGVLLLTQGKLDEGEPFFREALEGGRRALEDDQPEMLHLIDKMGVLLQRQGKPDEARPFLREALEGRRRNLGDDHPNTLESILNMGAVLATEGKLDEAEPFLREALESSRSVLGDDHSNTSIAIKYMGVLLAKRGKPAEAEPLCREALEGHRRVLGDDHPDTLDSILNMGALLAAQGKLDEAKPFLREALEGHRRVLGDDHPSTLNSIGRVGVLLQNQGKLAEAEPLLREALEGRRRVLGDDHPETLDSILNMGALLHSQGKLAEAEPFLREALEGFRRVLGDDHARTLFAIQNLSSVLVRLISNERAWDTSDRLGSHLADLGELLLLKGAFEQAEETLSEGFGFLAEQYGDTHWRSSAAVSSLGAAMAGQRRHEDAESLLLESAESLMADDSLSKGQRYLGVELVPTAIQRVAYFYAAWHEAAPTEGHDKQAAEWRGRLPNWNQEQGQ